MPQVFHITLDAQKALQHTVLSMATTTLPSRKVSTPVITAVTAAPAPTAPTAAAGFALTLVQHALHLYGPWHAASAQIVYQTYAGVNQAAVMSTIHSNLLRLRQLLTKRT